MTTREKLIYDLCKAKKENRRLAQYLGKETDKQQILISWLRINKPGIYEEFTKYYNSKGSNSTSKEIKS